MTSQQTTFAVIEEAAAPPHDDMADKLIANGLVSNSFLLDLNGCLSISRQMALSHPWNLPSRLFQFPIEVTSQQKDGSRNIGLRHPLLTEHPFVKHVETALGYTLNSRGAPNEYGSKDARIGTWWHAVDHGVLPCM